MGIRKGLNKAINEHYDTFDRLSMFIDIIGTTSLPAIRSEASKKSGDQLQLLP